MCPSIFTSWKTKGIERIAGRLPHLALIWQLRFRIGQGIIYWQSCDWLRFSHWVAGVYSLIALQITKSHCKPDCHSTFYGGYLEPKLYHSNSGTSFRQIQFKHAIFILFCFGIFHLARCLQGFWCSMSQNFISFDGWMLFSCMHVNILHFVTFSTGAYTMFCLSICLQMAVELLPCNMDSL